MDIHVLWVDDEPGTIRHEGVIASNAGWSLAFVQTAEDALHALQAKRFDLVILDLILPIDEYHQRRGGPAEPEAGVLLLESIRSFGPDIATSCDVPVLVFSAVVAPQLTDRVISHLGGPEDYISKPDLGELFAPAIQRTDALLKQRRERTPT